MKGLRWRYQIGKGENATSLNTVMAYETIHNFFPAHLVYCTGLCALPDTHICTPSDITPSPMVGIVVTISPSFNLYRIVVLPAASRPTIKILISFFPKRLLKRLANAPILLLSSSLAQQAAGWCNTTVSSHQAGLSTPPLTSCRLGTKHIKNGYSESANVTRATSARLYRTKNVSLRQEVLRYWRQIDEWFHPVYGHCLSVYVICNYF